MQRGDGHQALAPASHGADELLDAAVYPGESLFAQDRRRSEPRRLQ